MVFLNSAEHRFFIEDIVEIAVQNNTVFAFLCKSNL